MVDAKATEDPDHCASSMTTVGWRYENPKMDQLYPIISLGEGAELIAEDMQITREEQILCP